MRISELIDDVAASALPVAFMHQHMPDHALEDQALLPSVIILDQGRQSGFFFHLHLLLLYKTKRREKAKDLMKQQRKANTKRQIEKKKNHRAKENGKRIHQTKEREREEEDHTTQIEEMEEE